uniref:PDZ domain-containing protein n=1 Tax=Glossina brevipalpis TaxID=37001 RepID=A0A1A9WK21_9MUSC
MLIIQNFSDDAMNHMKEQTSKTIPNQAIKPTNNACDATTKPNVNGGSLAEQAGLMPGDSVIKINDVDVFNLRHKEAQDIVVRSGNNFVMTVQRGGSTWRPQVTPTGQLPQPNSPYLQTVTKTSLAHKQLESQHVGCGYNNAAKPFAQGGDGSVKSIVNKQYNSPVGIYSDESIAETLSAQAEVLAGGVLGYLSCAHNVLML